MNRARLVLQLLGRRGGAYIYRLGRRVVEGLLWSLGRGKHKISPHKKRKQKDTSIHDGGTHTVKARKRRAKSVQSMYAYFLLANYLKDNINMSKKEARSTNQGNGDVEYPGRTQLYRPVHTSTIFLYFVHTRTTINRAR